MSWTNNVPIPDQTSKASPALAAPPLFGPGGDLHMVHLGNSSNDIWHSTWNGSKWSPNVRISNHTSKASPALAWHRDVVHMVYLRDSSNDIWHSTWDGSEWSPKPIPNQTSKASPALASHRGLLHMVHLGNSSNDIWHSTWDGSEWSPNRRIPNQTSKASPALASLGGELLMVHLGNSSDSIWYSRHDGREWTPNLRSSFMSSKSPALVGNRMVYVESMSTRLFESEFDGESFFENVLIPNQTSKATPALGVFRSDVAELHMVHLGQTSNNLWHSIRSAFS